MGWRNSKIMVTSSSSNLTQVPDGMTGASRV